MEVDKNGGGGVGGASGESVKQDSHLVAATSEQLLVNTLVTPPLYLSILLHHPLVLFLSSLYSSCHPSSPSSFFLTTSPNSFPVFIITLLHLFYSSLLLPSNLSTPLSSDLSFPSWLLISSFIHLPLPILLHTNSLSLYSSLVFFMDSHQSFPLFCITSFTSCHHLLSIFSP